MNKHMSSYEIVELENENAAEDEMEAVSDSLYKIFEKYFS